MNAVTAAVRSNFFRVAPRSLPGRRTERLLLPVGAHPQATNATIIAKIKTHRISQPPLPLGEGIIIAKRPAAQATIAVMKLDDLENARKCAEKGAVRGNFHEKEMRGVASPRRAPFWEAS